jgi:hypothetical protein
MIEEKEATGGDASDVLQLPSSQQGRRTPSPVHSSFIQGGHSCVHFGSDGAAAVAESQCDIFEGKWIEDHSEPLYRNETCPFLSQGQNCPGNGRPDSDYINWRWKPTGCELPRFDGLAFLELMRGKTIAFVGDSVTRNQYEALMCTLWQVNDPAHKLALHELYRNQIPLICAELSSRSFRLRSRRLVATETSSDGCSESTTSKWCASGRHGSCTSPRTPSTSRPRT